MSAPMAATITNGTGHAEAANNVHAASGSLQSRAQDELLNMIDSLRLEGLDKHLSLPQLVVCGDQSSGKSSVLEAIAEIPFPRKENLCTRFATEIILRRKQATSMTVKIIPDVARPANEQATLADHKIIIHHIDELPSIIEQATKFMGLEETGEGKRAFSMDVLRLEIAGPHQPHLTLVDLPGLIHSENKVQTADDVEVIGKLVDKYIKNARTIILAVISARNDYANQIIIKKAREADSDARRTLGIITKPDDLYPSSDNEQAFINLAKNEDVAFALGWHVLRNRNAQEMNSSFAERESKETQFFMSTDWSQLPEQNRGISSLRSKLSDLLYKHIKQELPSLRKELDDIYIRTDTQLKQLGDSRATPQQQRQYLTGLSVKFHELTRSAANGSYDHDYFVMTPIHGISVLTTNSNRLRAVVTSCGLKFAEIMNEYGHKYCFNSHASFDPKSSSTTRSVKVGNRDVVIDQVKLFPFASLAMVKGVLMNNRGTELPGSFNPRLIGELYQIQSENWSNLALHHLEHVAGLCETFCNRLRYHLAPKGTSGGFLDSVIEEALAQRVLAAKTELKKLVEDEKFPPLTFNHYYTITIQNSRLQKRKRASNDTDDTNGKTKEKRAKAGGSQFGVPGTFGSASKTDGASPSQMAVSGKPATAVENENGDLVFEDGESNFDVSKVLMDMDEHSCRDALEALQSYYKVARKTFIDNIEKQVIRRHLINGLEDIFSPAVVAGWTDEEIGMAAREPKSVTVQRQELKLRLERLKKGIAVFKRTERMADE